MVGDWRLGFDAAASTVGRDLSMSAAGGTAVLLSLLALASCASTPEGDPLAKARQALAATEAAAVRTDGEPGEVVCTTVARFEALFANFDPATIGERARSVYAQDAYFNDGFVEAQGVNEIVAYLVRSAEAAGEVEIEVHDVAYSGPEIYLRWDMRFTTGSGSKVIVAPGVSHLRVSREGQVVFHRDHWDSSGALAEFVPLMSSILRKVRSRL